MPIYEYECKSCGETFDTYRSKPEPDETGKEPECPKCGERDTERVFSLFSGSPANKSCGTPVGSKFS